MKGKKAWMAALTIGLSIIFGALVIQADQWDKKTVLTVGETIQIPGGTLTPGKYVFRLMDSSSNRHIVQVFNEDQDHILATILAIPNYRLRPTGHSEFGFWEMPRGTPPALRSWFYPGDNFGQEFPYPKSEALQLAAITHQEVPFLPEEGQARAEDFATSEPAPATSPQPPFQQPEPSDQPSTETTAQVNPQSTEYPKAPSSAEPAAQPARPAKLPSTASSLPLIGLLGCVCLVMASIFRRLRSSH